MPDKPLDVVTGAFSYTGRAIARELLQRGRRVRTLTGHPHRPGSLPGVEAHPFNFNNPEALMESLAGATTLYNTYWVRFDRGSITFDRAVENSATLFRAAREAGVERIVHVSVTNPSQASRFPYFQGKAEVERLLVESHDSWAVVRPTVTFGPGDILMNNVAWLLRRFPVFAIPGDGAYRLRPVHVADVATLCVEQGLGGPNEAIDAVGPTTYTFQELVETVRRAIGSHAWLVRVPPKVAMLGATAAGLLARDVILTDHELGGMAAEVAYSSAPTSGSRAFEDWLAAEGPTLGRRYASELARHYR
ncbi:MAG: NAD-dependent epimerase/dehydratase family protein [Actinomycetes bacterium]